MTTAVPSASYSLTVRLEIENKPGMLGKVTSAIGKAGGDIGAVDLVEMRGGRVLRDITIKASDSQHGQDIIERLRMQAFECRETEADEFRVLVPANAGPEQLFASAAHVGAQVRHLKQSVPTLEDVFAEAMGEP